MHTQVFSYAAHYIHGRTSAVVEACSYKNLEELTLRATEMQHWRVLESAVVVQVRPSWWHGNVYPRELLSRGAYPPCETEPMLVVDGRLLPTKHDTRIKCQKLGRKGPRVHKKSIKREYLARTLLLRHLCR